MPVAVAVGRVSTTGSGGGGKGFRLLDGLLNMTMIVTISAKFPARAKMVRIFQVESFTFLRRFNVSPGLKLTTFFCVNVSIFIFTPLSRILFPAGIPVVNRADFARKLNRCML